MYDARSTGLARSPDDEERLRAAATPFGFQLCEPHKSAWSELGLSAFAEPSAIHARLTGEIRGTRVDFFHSEWRRRSKRRSEHPTGVVVVIRHPAIDGEARCTPSTWASATAGERVGWILVGLHAMLLLPLILVVGAVLLLLNAAGLRPLPKSFDWKVGLRAFDRRFSVDGPSLDQAKRALPRALQSFVLERDLWGPIEVRPGLVACGLNIDRVDGEVTFAYVHSCADALLTAYLGSARVVDPG